MTAPTYRLTLGKTYYNNGFFNLGVDIERYIFEDDCQMTLLLGENKLKINARMSRKPNANGTPRVFGGVELQKWFWENFNLNDEIDIAVLGSQELWLKSITSGDNTSDGRDRDEKNLLGAEAVKIVRHSGSRPRDAVAISGSESVSINVGEYSFQYVRDLEPLRNDEGQIVSVLPQSRYDNKRSITLNRYGAGPFCKFTIPRNYQQSGVYVLTSDQAIMYIGECQNLTERYNSGYGNISPKNCFVGGQETNCRINNLIFKEVVKGNNIKLWFLPVPNFKEVEAELRAAINTNWNRV